MGFARQPSPQVIAHARATSVETLIIRDDLAIVTREANPFLIDNCCVNATWHYAIAACGQVVCAHCARIFWS